MLANIIVSRGCVDAVGARERFVVVVVVVVSVLVVFEDDLSDFRSAGMEVLLSVLGLDFVTRLGVVGLGLGGIDNALSLNGRCKFKSIQVAPFTMLFSIKLEIIMDVK